MKYAVVASGGKQYKIQEGDTLVVEKLPVKASDAYTFSQVLLFVDGDKRLIGRPNVSGAVVKATVIGDKKTAKIRVAKFKAKAKYRRVKGHRQTMTHMKIESISAK